MKIINPKIIHKKNGYAYTGTYIAKKTVGIFIKYRNKPLQIEEYKAIGGQDITSADLEDTIALLENEIKIIDIPNEESDKKNISKNITSHLNNLSPPFKYNVFSGEVIKVTYNRGLLYKPTLQISTKSHTLIWQWTVWRKGDFKDTIQASPSTINILKPEEITILTGTEEYKKAQKNIELLFEQNSPKELIINTVLNAGCNIFRMISLSTDSD